ncbi:hypothetical protein BEP19_09060 [Ammoniphilus oxalaticus]|uniref:Uncharacterized protein n=1 Tax=Ammoniphilus oxalaticus TaxID=66863 RepID=A0A419SKL9_9BACL|nr:hypothetical protein [Ammoniphilus oxalaticus]RKD24522.1 hypothetical protein BEP19_09060 [Ammoniphilus oxalaticus]
MVVDEFRLIFLLFIVLLSLFIVGSVLYKGRYKARFKEVGMMAAIVCPILSAKFMWDIGIIADETGRGGDPVSSLMFFVIVGLSFSIFIFTKSRAAVDETWV